MPFRSDGVGGGWAIADDREHSGEHDEEDARALYTLLEQEIAKEFYDRDEAGIPRAWIARVRHSMTRLTAQFSSDRMVREYVEQAYLPAAEAYRRRSADGGRLARELTSQLVRIDDEWQSLRFGRVAVHQSDEQWHFEVHVMLGGLNPDSVEVQLYADPGPECPQVCAPMQREGRMHGVVNGYLYRAAVPTGRPAEHYTPRIVPRHPEALIPMECSRIAWQG